MGIVGALRALFRHLKAFPILAIAVVETVLFDTLFETAVPLLLSWIVDRAVIPGRADQFLLPAALMLGGWFVSLFVQVGRDYWLADLTAKISARVRERLAAHLNGLSYSQLRHLRSAEWQALHTSDLAQVENLLLNVLPLFLFGLFYLVFGIAAMVFTNVWLGLLVLLGLPLTLIGPWLLAEKGVKEGLEVREAETAAAAAAGELYSGQPVLRTFNLTQAFASSFRSKTQEAMRRVRTFAFTTNLTRRLPNLAIHLLQIVVVLVGTWLALDGRLKIGEFLAFNLLFANVLTAVLDLASALGPLQRSAPALESLQLRLDSETSAAPSSGAAVSPLTRGLRFENVFFRYDPQRRVLEGVSFTVPAGRRTAVVGASGSGKSTLAALIAGLYTPEEGHVWWDQTDLSTVDRELYRQRLGIVFQDNPVFDTSLRENIVLRAPQAGDDEAVWRTLEAAGLAAWVRSLPEGLETRAGEEGGFLSGGQRQRLALARALFRQPALLVLDEATSALDPMTEAHVNDTLRALTSTTILHITHRLQGIADYDHIVVLGEGRVVESGTHDDLVAAEGAYSLLWRRQSGLVVADAGAQITPEGLKAIPLFSSSNEATLQDLARSFVSETADPGQRLIRQGQPGTRFFVIARGRVEVSVGTAGKEKGIATLADGDFFGEMSLLDAVLTSAHVTASLPSVLLTLEKTTFLALVARDKALGAAVAATAKRRREENSRWQNPSASS